MAPEYRVVQEVWDGKSWQRLPVSGPMPDAAVAGAIAGSLNRPRPTAPYVGVLGPASVQHRDDWTGAGTPSEFFHPKAAE